LLESWLAPFGQIFARPGFPIGQILLVLVLSPQGRGAAANIVGEDASYAGLNCPHVLLVQLPGAHAKVQSLRKKLLGRMHLICLICHGWLLIAFLPAAACFRSFDTSTLHAQGLIESART